jgi:beta-1,4-mannooligosaccharide/beta-1,4-mannosyl-N-acetylglucosamine phosphorylase
MTDTKQIFTRCSDQPLLHPEYWPTPIQAVFNPGVAEVDGQVVLLCRVTDRRGLSYLQVARSKNGLNDWHLDPEPLIKARDGHPEEQWGTEDPRVVWMPEKKAWAIVYTIYGSAGPAVALAFTKDFRSIDEYCGQIMPPEDKDAVLLPEKVNGRFALLHRPICGKTGTHLDIRVSYSEDMKTWSKAEVIMSPRQGAWWDSVRVGAGGPLIKTGHGLLMFYHGTILTYRGPVYRVGSAILDAKTLRMKYRADEWLLGPEVWYEREGNVSNVVFPCGAVADESADKIRLYYGAADTCIGAADAKLSQVITHTLRCPVVG